MLVNDHLDIGDSSQQILFPLKSYCYGMFVDSFGLCSAHPAVLQASSGQWYQMNDSLVHSSNIKAVLDQQAYVLFYLR